MNVEWQLERFDALQLRQLYELLQLRSAVFAVEQNCVYQDLDDLDFEAFHLLGCKQETGQLLAYARCLPAGLIAQGDVYLEDGIRHQMMLRPACREPDKSKSQAQPPA
ncbi:MAG: hypothetical protein EBS52_07965 [Betaproteobacteria bacterium]|nr:hypothetical protein [Betaproteobacteria bacterium]